MTIPYIIAKSIPVKIIRRLKRKLIAECKKFKFICSLRGKDFFLIGTPTHTNIGDVAIAFAEKVFLVQNIPAGRILEITTTEFYLYQSVIIREKPDYVCWHGGGNMGDQWYEEEELRQRGLAVMPEVPTVIFPQTIFYSDTPEGREKAKKSVPFYNSKSMLTLCAREKSSYQIMRKLYPTAKVVLIPDIVLSTTMDDYGVVATSRKGALFVTRSDPEKLVPDTVWDQLRDAVEKKGLTWKHTDMYSETPVSKHNRRECVRVKMQEFCEAQLVITDRLHGMVFAALTGTPCVVFSNYNHKVKGTYDWISYLSYIKYVESAEAAEAVIPELLEMKNCRYDNSPLKPYFDQLAEEINHHAQNYRYRPRI